MRARGRVPTRSSDPANPTIIVDPPSNLPVTTAPIFSGPTTCWTPIAVTNPGKQTTSVGHRRQPARPAIDASPSETLAYRATGLPAGLSINPSSGVISGRPSVRGKKHVTVTVSDSVDSAAVDLHVDREALSDSSVKHDPTRERSRPRRASEAGARSRARLQADSARPGAQVLAPPTTLVTLAPTPGTEPRNVASPKEKTPPSEPKSQ